MRVLVTGGAGFVGANLVDYLLDRGHEVVALDDLSAGARPAWWGHDSRPTSVAASIEDEAAVQQAMDGVDGVVHLAARPGVADSVDRPDLDFRTNVLGTFTVFDAARRANVSRFVFASSGAVLAAASPPLREDMAPAPKSPYGASKLYGEGITAAGDAFGMVGLSLRFSNVYGPHCGHKKSVIASFLSRALAGQPLVVYGDGQQTRDFIYVEDICAAIDRALGAGEGGVYHLGTGVETSVNELADRVIAAAGTRVEVERQPPRPADATRSFVEYEAARKALGWSPRIRLDEGLARTAEWMRSSRRQEA
ncbi:MAG: GDP-mannose 4,6-dehydratase [Actinomycetota bacterium]|nr:GDP-mannose 4,6-dehydratase [Actinomycetota bacterium]